MHLSAVLMLICLWMVEKSPVSFGQSNTPPQPEQTGCQARLAIFFNQNLISKLPKEWFVGRVSIRTFLPPTAPIPTINTCVPLSYLEDCKGGIHIKRDWVQNGDVIKITKAYSTQYDNIVEYWESQGRADPNYFIYEGFGTRMILHFRDKTTQEIHLADMPELVYYAQARQYAMTAYEFKNNDNEVEWVLYQDCEEALAWVEIAQSVIKENRLQEVNENIDNFLSNVQVPQMSKIPPVLPFQV